MCVVDSRYPDNRHFGRSDARLAHRPHHDEEAVTADGEGSKAVLNVLVAIFSQPSFSA